MESQSCLLLIPTMQKCPQICFPSTEALSPKESGLLTIVLAASGFSCACVYVCSKKPESCTNLYLERRDQCLENILVKKLRHGFYNLVNDLVQERLRKHGKYVLMLDLPHSLFSSTGSTSDETPFYP